ncbi:hypothetical protein UFOVP51_62 [uncultured Caudovirales phage]|uniref:Uncharacterized protein n=1 Tax=uncultured Caudovirales phage TaxID=2100421 RepID=A0A6J5T838_9CAUD|nr:hypothetical protein UFOVP51_62 [uncultured Caudovirales phage]CAB4240924.1 hypothetical protein UFOVP34_44 [uncultured Caudovirales phage]
MGVFVDYPSNLFSNLKNVETTILTANTHPIQVTGLIVCNRTSYTILVNLKKVRSQISSISVYEINDFEIKAYDTVDIVAAKGLNIYLQYSTTPDPSISDSLAIFSNGYTQVFDCDISYIILNDLPLPPAP